MAKNATCAHTRSQKFIYSVCRDEFVTCQILLRWFKHKLLLFAIVHVKRSSNYRLYKEQPKEEHCFVCVFCAPPVCTSTPEPGPHAVVLTPFHANFFICDSVPFNFLDFSFEPMLVKMQVWNQSSFGLVASCAPGTAVVLWKVSFLASHLSTLCQYRGFCLFRQLHLLVPLRSLIVASGTNGCSRQPLTDWVFPFR